MLSQWISWDLIYKVLHSYRAVPRNFSWVGVKLVCADKMGVVGDIWAWSIKFRVLYTMKIWRDGKA